jgi:hypothetical protein
VAGSLTEELEAQLALFPVPDPQRGREAFWNTTGLLTICVALRSGTHCNSSVPAAPALAFTVSGYVYAQHTPEFGEPLVADAVITARDSEGHERSAVTDSKGFYVVPARSGVVSMNASKTGYETGIAQEFTLSQNTVLNFRLIPTSAGSQRNARSDRLPPPLVVRSWALAQRQK